MKTCKDYNIPLCEICLLPDEARKLYSPICWILFFNKRIKEFKNIKDFIIQEIEYFSNDQEFKYVKTTIETIYPEYVSVLNKYLILK